MLEQSRPGESEAGFLALSLPPMTGAEYFAGPWLPRFYLEFEQALQAKFNAYPGSFPDFLRSLSPVWKNVGKVTSHLAENKGDASGDHPFAFMASFIYRADCDRSKHLQSKAKPAAGKETRSAFDYLGLVSLLDVKLNRFIMSGTAGYGTVRPVV